MGTIADLTSSQYEAIIPDIQAIYRNMAGKNLVYFNVIRGKFADVTEVSNRDSRIPVQHRHGVSYGTYNPDGGNTGRGGNIKVAHMTIGKFSTKAAIELTKDQIDSNRTKAQSEISGLVARQSMECVKAVRQYDDAVFFSSPDGGANGVIGYASAQTGSPTVYTLGDTTNPIVTNLLQVGQKVIIYQNDLSAARDSGAVRTIEAIDRNTHKITLDAAVTSAGATDKVLFDGVSGATPVFRYGLYYFVQDAVTGNLLTLSKATYPELAAASVNANSGLLNEFHGMLLVDQMTMRSGQAPSDLLGICPLPQRARIRQLQISLSNIQKSGALGGMVDTVVSNDDSFTWAGIQWRCSMHAAYNSLPVVNPSMWGEVSNNGGNPDWIKDPDGKTWFAVYSTSTGTANTAWARHLARDANTFCKSPNTSGYIKNLALPSFGSAAYL